LEVLRSVQHYRDPLTSLPAPTGYEAALTYIPAQAAEQEGIRVSSAVHDFNNFLSVILSHASVAANRLPIDSPIRSNLDRITRTARRAAELTSQMQADIRSRGIEYALIDLNQVVLETVDLLNPKLSPKAEVSMHLASDLGLVLANDLQLQQVLMNLLLNAADAIQELPGRITLTTRNLLMTEARHSRPTTLAAGEYILLQVEDTGIGMNQEILEHIFEPFYTTKATGTGIGLSSMLGIIQTYRGGVEVYSTLGYGTMFRVFLPAFAD